ncbi:glycoside hydrolase family 2 protein [Streptococcus sp. S784/96/1]|uniref:glycoside hydrolase family 2 protein n=1 Tax=Streptococcus sp. S784/96/1 TaxID=2653499 RepID=UPI0013894F7A|nr:glycoside hydrolase family 2 TIM barrel-domain containing protein [Streptococcus sp. S784/96/1]
MKRTEYPRPQFVREKWLNLNGEWQFEFDDKNEGLVNNWNGLKEIEFTKHIQVPFVYQSEASGINDRSVHDVVWYKKQFFYHKNERAIVYLHFGAVDYEAMVYVNGQLAGTHVGGNTPFKFDVSNLLEDSGNQEVIVRVTDRHDDEEMPRGKQFWEKTSRGIWYTNSTGIWQTVWLEEVNQSHIDDLRYHIRYDEGMVNLAVRTLGSVKGESKLVYRISYQDEIVSQGEQLITSEVTTIAVDVIQGHIFSTNFHDDGRSWTPENPNLFDVELKLMLDDTVIDRVTSYFGFRKIHTKNGMVFLNNKPFYQKLVLDQGYWSKGLLTAPSDDDFIKDIDLAKAMGFNGCRKHQKMEDPRFLYWADVKGFVVWGECAAPPIYSERSVARLMVEWTEIINRDINHPSIITWVPINESWGVPNISHDRMQQHFSQAMYHYIHSLDNSRLVISNDGWAATETDIVAIHNYMHGQNSEKDKYNYYRESLFCKESLINNPSTAWPIFADGFGYQGQPILLTEFGGIAYEVSNQEGWGYTKVGSEEEFLEDYKRIMSAIYASKGLWGYCYTQLTDVEQEINGLLTYNRDPKCDLEKIKKINDGYHIPNVE